MFFLLINWQNVSFPPLVFPYVRCVIIYITWFVCSLIALYVFWHFGNENDFPLKKTKTNKIIVLFSICRWGRVKKEKKFAFSVFFWQDSYTLISFSRRQYSPFVMCIRRCVNVWVDVIDWLNQFNNSAIFFSFATPKTRSHQAKRRKCEFPFRFSFDFFFFDLLSWKLQTDVWEWKNKTLLITNHHHFSSSTTEKHTNCTPSLI